MHNTVALYTTLYSGCEPYLKDWEKSIFGQLDKNFDIWVGVDGLSESYAKKLMSNLNIMQFLFYENNESIAIIRKESLSRMCEIYDVIMLCDCDDILSQSRVNIDLEHLKHYDVVGCSMGLIDQESVSLNKTLGVGNLAYNTGNSIVFNNQFGMTNVSYKSSVLKKCLNISPACEIVDWFLITSAWLHDARIYFDDAIRMYYRIYSNNMIDHFEFNLENIISMSELVVAHYDRLIAAYSGHKKMNIIMALRNDIKIFIKNIKNKTVLFSNYLSALKDLENTNLWWAAVANPKLERIWNQ